MFVNFYLASSKVLSLTLCCSHCTPSTNPLSLIISKHKGIKFHFYADDSQVYLHLSEKNASAAFVNWNRCVYDVKEWMSTSKLKLNPDKTEFIIFDSKRQRDKLKACFPIDILGNPFCLVDSVKNLGVWFDSDFSLSKHVLNVCKSCFVKLCAFRHVRRFLTHDVSVLVDNALVSSQLDYCNSLFRSLTYANYSASKTVQPELYQHQSIHQHNSCAQEIPLASY